MHGIETEVSHIIRETILVLAALFPIVNPLGSAAIFLNLVGTNDPQIHRILSQKVAIYSFFLLVASLLWGVKVLSFFGISISAVQIGGGLVVAVTGWSLLGQDRGTQKTGQEQKEGVLDRAFYPFTLPVTVGPGSISVAITLGAHLMGNEGSVVAFLAPQVLIPALAGVALVCVIIYICFRYARAAEQMLGKTGTSVFLRLSSFILLCIGIQIILTGVSAFLKGMPH